MLYKTELHCHTSELSGCSSESAFDTLNRYAELGYTSVVITNHFSSHEYKRVGLKYRDYVERHFEVAEAAAEKMKGRLYVIPGFEMRLNSNNNDYLVFGATREVLLDIPDVFRMELSELHEYLSAAGCLIIQAHPFRWDITIVRPEYIDGYEVLNSHGFQKNHNDIAMLFAKSVGGEGKILTAGSDHHDPCQTPRSGIMTKDPIVSSSQLVSVLKSGHYHLFGEDKYMG